MKKMLYLLNVNWDWIKQRPQYLAEAMSRYYDVDVYEKKIYCRKNLIENKECGVNLHSLFKLPLQGKSKIIKAINKVLLRYQLRKIVNNYDYIWITDANDYDLIKGNIDDKKIIYDCMDDYIEFPNCKKNEEYIDKYVKNERKLLKKSYCVFTSSEYLRNVLFKRYHEIKSREIYVINNAVSKRLLEKRKTENKESRENKENKERKIITYIGTISNWMDWNIILKSLDVCKNIEYHFYGPCEVDIPRYKNILYKGIASQEDIFSIMNKSDLLIMPFVVNDLIRSVNPVKLYEYILSEVPVLACRYEETEKFKDYVYLYRDEVEYINFIKKLSSEELKAKSENGVDFVKNNTWETRANEVLNIIEGQR